jgi:hypothetical protein
VLYFQPAGHGTGIAILLCDRGVTAEEVTMKKSLILVAAAIATVLLSAPGAAKAQVAFGGTFRGPHGVFSIGVGGPFVPVVGAYVPAPYFDQVYLSPDYGYGFVYDSRWIPCRRYGSRWIIAGSPVAFHRPFIGYGHRYVRPYHSPRYFHRFRDDRHFRRGWDDRRW